jgi:hypothetical protein
VILAALVLIGAGCAMSDPTEATFSAGFRNDLGFDVRLAICSSSNCNAGTEFSNTIKAGQVVAENITSDSVVQPFRIADMNGRTLGCLPVFARHRRSDLVIRLSLMSRCPGKEIRVA